MRAGSPPTAKSVDALLKWDLQSHELIYSPLGFMPSLSKVAADFAAEADNQASLVHTVVNHKYD